MFDPSEPSSQKVAALYRFDGRNYEITEVETALTLRLRSSAVLEKRINAAIIFSLLIALFLAGSASARWWLLRSVTNLSPVFGWIGVLTLFGLGGYLYRLLHNDTCWEFQKYAGAMHCRRNDEISIPLPEIDSLKGWRRGNKYYLAVKVPGRRMLQIGSFGYAVKERVWLDDARQIANFLEVPLEIKYD